MVLRRDPEKAAAKAEAKVESKQQKANAKAEQQRQAEEAAWWNTPPGQARQAREQGRKVLQLAFPLESRTRTAMGVFGGDSTSSGMKVESQDHAGLIEEVEAEGWKLDHAGYVFKETGSVSRDKLLSSGQTGSVTGEVVGIYLFRLDPGWAAPETPPPAPMP